MGSPLRPAKKAVKQMLSLHHELLTRMYVEDRLAQAAEQRLINAAEQARREKGEAIALTARVGRTLVNVGRRLEAVGAA